MNIVSSFRIVRHVEPVGSILKLNAENHTWYSVRLNNPDVSAEVVMLADAVTAARAFYPDVEVADD